MLIDYQELREVITQLYRRTDIGSEQFSAINKVSDILNILSPSIDKYGEYTFSKLPPGVIDELRENPFAGKYLEPRRVLFINVSIWEPNKAKRSFFSGVSKDLSNTKYLSVMRMYMDHTEKLKNESPPLYTANEFIAREAFEKKSVEICFYKACERRDDCSLSIGNCFLIDKNTVEMMYNSEIENKMAECLDKIDKWFVKGCEEEELPSINEDINKSYDILSQQRTDLLENEEFIEIISDFRDFLEKRFILQDFIKDLEKPLVIMQYLSFLNKFLGVNHWYAFTYYLPGFEDKQKKRFTSSILALGSKLKLSEETKVMMEGITHTLLLYPVSELLPEFQLEIRDDWCSILGEAFKRGGIEWLTHGLTEGKYTYGIEGREIEVGDDNLPGLKIGIKDAIKKIDKIHKIAPSLLINDLNINEIKIRLAELAAIVDESSDYKIVKNKIKNSPSLEALIYIIKIKMKINLHEKKEEGGVRFNNIPLGFTPRLKEILDEVFGNKILEWRIDKFEKESFFLPKETLKACLNGEFKADIEKYKSTSRKVKVSYAVHKWGGNYSLYPFRARVEDNTVKKVVLKIWYEGEILPGFDNREIKTIKSLKSIQRLEYFGDIYIQSKIGNSIRTFNFGKSKFIDVDIIDTEGNPILLKPSDFTEDTGVGYIFLFTLAPLTPTKPH